MDGNSILVGSPKLQAKRKKMSGPVMPYSQRIFQEKYAGEGETFRDAMSRVAGALQDSPEHYHEFRDILLSNRFSPAGRILAAMGSLKYTTPYNCYVSGTIEDSFVEGSGNIMQRATEAATTMRMGGGIGYNFGTLRPDGSLIKKLLSHSNGPVAFMGIWNEICKVTSSAGNRRGAQMAVMPVWHPDIEAFIHCKQPPAATRALWEHVMALEPETEAEQEEKARLFQALQATLPLTGFNVSVGITDKFMECLETGRPFPLEFGGEVHREVDPQNLWEMIMRGTWDWAEPGVLFMDNINNMNNLSYCETIAATNPCGEQPLPPFGACLLGSINCVKYLSQLPTTPDDMAPRHTFDWDQLIADIPHIHRAMDNVVDRARYPLAAQRAEALNKRRMGIGITGLANAAEAMGFEYGSPWFLEFEAQLLRTLNNELYRASANMAEEKGSFPLYDEERYMDAPFIKQLDPEVQGLMRRSGVRNSHLTSIAPTGTISFYMDNVSSSIEPVFSYGYDRDVIMPEGKIVETVHDYGAKFLGVKGKRSMDVTADEHVDVLLTAATLVDSAVSKTCNVSPQMPWEDFKNIYKRVWEGGGKGCTTYNPAGGRAGVLRSTDDDTIDEGATCEIINGVKSCE